MKLALGLSLASLFLLEYPQEKDFQCLYSLILNICFSIVLVFALNNPKGNLKISVATETQGTVTLE